MLQQESLLNSRLVYLNEIQARNPILYSVLLLFMLIVMVLLPFLKITISVTGKGIIQSEITKTDIIAPINGQVIQVNLIDNQRVSKGETLLIVDDAFLKQQSSLLSVQRTYLLNQLKDVENLVNAINSEPMRKPDRLTTSIYVASWQLYTAYLKQTEKLKKQTYQAYERHERLYAKKVISLSEWEQYRFNYEQAALDQEMINKKFISQWLTEAERYRKELRSVKLDEVYLNEQKTRQILKANITGSIQSVIGIQNGTYVSANQKLGEISPESKVLAICYVKSSDIAFIKKGQVVRFQIDAFRHSQSSLLQGKVFDISDDVIVENQVSYFKVKCQLDKAYLHAGNIKKGMTFVAGFTVAKRRLYQLLLDRSRGWLW
jgi:HlyD family secretion protein